MLLLVGVGLVEMLIPIVTKARLDSICHSFSEQMALNQSFSPEIEEALLHSLDRAGLTEIRIEAEDMGALKRGDRANFAIFGELPGRRLVSWHGFEPQTFAYRYERSIICRKILN